MEYDIIKRGIFIDRPNRFIAHVEIDGREETVHVKNTGRCRELLRPGARVILEEGKGRRKTRYSLVAVYKGENLVNMDSQAPNAAALEAVSKGMIPEIGVPDVIKREKRFGSSRFDIYYEKNGKKGFVEVKGVTLEYDGLAMFPDAPTIRGARHLRELAEAVKEGFEAWALFVVQMKNIHSFRANREMDPDFSDALEEAVEGGVGVLIYDCIVEERGMKLDKKIPSSGE